MTSPTTTPPKRGLITAGLIIGGLLTLAPLVGVAGTALGMMKAFNALGAGGAGSTQELSEGVGQALVATAVGVLLFIPGVVILTISIIRYRRAKREEQTAGWRS